MGCISVFHTLFLSREDQGLLDPEDCKDLFCLHFVFLPRLNHALNLFLSSYNHHPLRTAGNKSPYQLWITGMAECSGDSAAIQGLEEDVVPVRSNNTTYYITVI